MATIVSRLEAAHQRFVSLANRAQSPLLLLIRLYWGWQFAQDGWGKLTHLDHVATYFAQLGLPAPGMTAMMVGAVEFGGGILLAVGLLSRIVSLVLFVNMTVAFWTAEKSAFLGVISNPDKFQAADAYNYWFAALLILVFGPGLIALDEILSRRFARRTSAGSRALS